MTTRPTEATSVTLPPDLLLNLRKLVPKRAMLFSEALTVAKVQANRARALLDQTSPHADLGWILRLPNTRVDALPAHQIRELTRAEASGLTKRLKNGDYYIAVNKNASHSHRRFTLAHELKHMLDYPYDDTLYARLGYGDAERRSKQIERIADAFAAHYLVPTRLLKAAWTRGFQEVAALAGMFGVSEEAMQIRLLTEGYGDEQRPTHTYFRRIGLLPEHNAIASGVAA